MLDERPPGGCEMRDFGRQSPKRDEGDGASGRAPATTKSAVRSCTTMKSTFQLDTRRCRVGGAQSVSGGCGGAEWRRTAPERGRLPERIARSGALCGSLKYEHYASARRTRGLPAGTSPTVNTRCSSLSNCCLSARAASTDCCNARSLASRLTISSWRASAFCFESILATVVA